MLGIRRHGVRVHQIWIHPFNKVKCDRTASSLSREEAIGSSRLPSAPPQVCPVSVVFGPWRRGGSWPSSAGGLRFAGFSVQVCCGGTLLVVATLLTIMYPQLQPHLGSDVEKLV